MSELLSTDNNNSQWTNVIDLEKGSQLGHMPDPANWTSAAFYMRPQIIPVLMQAPLAFKYLPDGAGMTRRLKALVETKARAITGLNSSLTAEFEEVVASKSGEVMQTLTKVSRERSNPNITWNEYKGMPIFKDFSRWMIDLLEDPLTGAPGVIRYASYQDDGSPELMGDDISMTVLFIQPNHNLTGVDYAYMCTNMMPITLTNESALEQATARVAVEHSIDFTAFTLPGDQVDSVMREAQEYLDSVNKNGFAPNAMNPFVDEIDPSLLEEAIGNSSLSYRGGAEAVAQNL
jgi:hypothetical protein